MQRGSGSPRERELTEEVPESFGVLTNVGVDLGVGALEVGIGDDAGTAVARSDHVHHVQITRLDHPVEMRVNEIQTRRGAKMTEEPWFHVVRQEWLPQERVIHQIDLTNRAVVGGSPIAIDGPELVLIQLILRGRHFWRYMARHHKFARHGRIG